MLLVSVFRLPAFHCPSGVDVLVALFVGIVVPQLFPLPIPFAKARKRIETLFSQLTGQFLVIRNYAKITDGLFARIIGKISALTVLQYVNYINNKPIGRIKYCTKLIPPTGKYYLQCRFIME